MLIFRIKNTQIYRTINALYELIGVWVGCCRNEDGFAFWMTFYEENNKEYFGARLLCINYKNVRIVNKYTLKSFRLWMCNKSIVGEEFNYIDTNEIIVYLRNY